VGTIKEQTFSGVKWTALESASTRVITFVLSILLARLLTPTDFGTIGVLAVFMAVSQTFIDSGFTHALVRKPDLSNDDCCTVFYFNIVIALVCYGMLFFGAPLIAHFFKMEELTSVVRVYCFTLVIGALEAVQITRLTIRLDFKSLAKINVASSFASGVLGVALAYYGFGVWALVWQSVGARVFHLTLTWFAAKWCPSLTFSTKSFRELFAFGSKLLLGNLLWTADDNLTPVLIGKFFQKSDLGFYDRGKHFAYLPSSTIMDILDRVTFPILAKIQDDRDRLLLIYRKYIRSSSMAIMFPLLLLAALARPAIGLLLGEKWFECAIYLQVFIFATLFTHIQRLNLNLLKVTGRSDYVLKIEVWKRLISISMIFAGVPFGVLGICVARVIYAQIALLFNTYYTGKLFGLGYVTQWRDFVPYVAQSVLACAPAYALTFTPLPHWAAIAIGGPVACVCYWLLLQWRKDASYVEFVLPALRRVLKGKTA